MKKVKYLFLFGLSVCILLLFSIAASADAAPADIKVNPYGNEEGSSDTVGCFVSGGEYWLVLPSDTEWEDCVLYCNVDEAPSINGTAISDGDINTVFTADGSYTVSCGGSSQTLNVCRSSELPAVFITTKSGSLDYIHANKENKESGTIRVHEDGEMTLDSALKQIKGRGNATWAFEKKPYNIKFDSKTKLLGMAKAKKWTMLASYADPSLTHNAAGWYLAEKFGLYATSEYRYADLWINGNYVGNYIFCESVEIGSNRIDINDLGSANEDANDGVDLDTLPRGGTGENGSVPSGTVRGSAKWVNIPNDPEDIRGGYLLECDFSDRYNAEISGFVTPSGQCITIKEPELASEAEVRYIQSIVNAAFEALESDDGRNAAGKHYSEYFDMDSFVSMYILQEISKNIDAGLSSFYLYKAEDSDKLTVSPVWDMDHAFGDRYQRFGSDIGAPSAWWSNSVSYTYGNKTRTILTKAYRHEDFRDLAAARWAEITADGILENAADYQESLSDTLCVSGALNGIRWNHFGKTTLTDNISAFRNLAAVNKSFLLERKNYLTAGFSPDACMLYYDANGGTGEVYNHTITSVGDSVTVKGLSQAENCVTAPAGGTFYGWNTRPDGTGVTYQPGDTITLDKRTVTLYALWTEPVPEEPAEGVPEEPAEGENFFTRLINFFRMIIEWIRNLFI